MAAISQTIFSDAFSWKKSLLFWFIFPWSLFLSVQLTIIQHWFTPNMQQVIIWTNADPIHWRIYAVQGEMSSNATLVNRILHFTLSTWTFWQVIWVSWNLVVIENVYPPYIKGNIYTIEIWFIFDTPHIALPIQDAKMYYSMIVSDLPFYDHIKLVRILNTAI